MASSTRFLAGNSLFGYVAPSRTPRRDLRSAAINDDTLPRRMAARAARRAVHQNRIILTSLVGLLLVLLVAISTALVLAPSDAEPFAIQSDAEIVTVDDLG